MSLYKKEHPEYLRLALDSMINQTVKPDEIVLVGYDLGICVMSNAVLLRAKYPNTKMVVKTDLCGCVSEQTFKAACEVLKLQQIDLLEG